MSSEDNNLPSETLAEEPETSEVSSSRGAVARGNLPPETSAEEPETSEGSSSRGAVTRPNVPPETPVEEPETSEESSSRGAVARPNLSPETAGEEPQTSEESSSRGAVARRPLSAIRRDGISRASTSSTNVPGVGAIRRDGISRASTSSTNVPGVGAGEFARPVEALSFKKPSVNTTDSSSAGVPSTASDAPNTGEYLPRNTTADFADDIFRRYQERVGEDTQSFIGSESSVSSFDFSDGGFLGGPSSRALPPLPPGAEEPPKFTYLKTSEDPGACAIESLVLVPPSLVGAVAEGVDPSEFGACALEWQIGGLYPARQKTAEETVCEPSTNPSSPGRDDFIGELSPVLTDDSSASHPPKSQGTLSSFSSIVSPSPVVSSACSDEEHWQQLEETGEEQPPEPPSFFDEPCPSHRAEFSEQPGPSHQPEFLDQPGPSHRPQFLDQPRRSRRSDFSDQPGPSHRPDYSDQPGPSRRPDFRDQASLPYGLAYYNIAREDSDTSVTNISEEADAPLPFLIPVSPRSGSPTFAEYEEFADEERKKKLRHRPGVFDVGTTDDKRGNQEGASSSQKSVKKKKKEPRLQRSQRTAPPKRRSTHPSRSSSSS